MPGDHTKSESLIVAPRGSGLRTSGDRHPLLPSAPYDDLCNPTAIEAPVTVIPFGGLNRAREQEQFPHKCRSIWSMAEYHLRS